MLVDISFFAEPRAAMLALIRALALMHGANVLGQGALVRESGLTSGAFKRTIFVMDCGDVLMKVVLPFEHGATPRTRGLLPRRRDGRQILRAQARAPLAGGRIGFCGL